jgi:hypothetical protein
MSLNIHNHWTLTTRDTSQTNPVKKITATVSPRAKEDSSISPDFHLTAEIMRVAN